MSMNDLMSDFVARVNNARLAKNEEVVILKNKLTLAVSKKLVTLGYFKGFDEGPKGTLILQLDLTRLKAIKRVSKPGRRVYAGIGEVPKIIGGRGFTLLTTSSGIMTQVECAKNKIGGEVVLQVY